MTDRLSRARRGYAVALGLLLVAFLGRVFGQLLQSRREVAWLPPFDAWHSATIPYATLLALQAAVTLACVAVIWRLASGRTRPSRKAGRVLAALGTAYFGFMAARLLLGFTLLAHLNWWNAPLASAFHLVLAAFVLTLARFHLRHAVGR